MHAKLLIALLIAINCYSSCAAALRRTPKVYNALITTDDNLTSSRAYPVIQPTIHESGLAHYPFGPYNPYGGYYTPPVVRFGQPIVPGLPPGRPQQFPYPLPQSRFPPQYVPQPPQPEPQIVPGTPIEQQPGYPAAAAVATAQPPPSEAQQPVKPPTSPPPPQTPAYMPPIETNPPKQLSNEKLPIPLNEYGLPPSLIPLQQYPNRNPGNPVQLPPYAYNQYPLLYDPITGYREQYLPPYEYYPSQQQHFAVGGGAPRPPAQAPAPPSQPQPLPAAPPSPAEDVELAAPAEETAASEDSASPPSLPPQLPAPAVDFESIKNASKIKNSAVPDVPPPPIPSGAKAKQS